TWIHTHTNPTVGWRVAFLRRTSDSTRLYTICGSGANPMTLTHSRRTFMSVFTSLAGIAAVQTSEAAAQTAPSAGDLGWLDAFRGQHKQVYDYGAYDLSPDRLPPLRFPRNYLNSVRDTYRLHPPPRQTPWG